MAFREAKTNPWLTQRYTSDRYGFESSPLLSFGDHPFKITQAYSEAPLITSDTTSINPNYTNQFNRAVNITRGNVYDLSRYSPNVRSPLYIARRQDNRYVAIRGQSRTFLTEEELESMKVSVTMDDQYILKIKTKGGLANTDAGDGMLFFDCEFRETTTNPVVASRIFRAAILTSDELKQKYTGTTINRFGATLPDRFRNRVRTFIFYSPEASRYECLNSARLSFTKGEPLPDVTTYSPQLRNQMGIENAGGGGPFLFSFISVPGGLPTLKHHLFLRIS